MERRRWREVSLVVLGVVLHSLYMLSIFDIYFKSPIVTGMQLEPPNIQAPANRLVLFIGTLFFVSGFTNVLVFIFRWKCEPNASVWRKNGVLGKFPGHEEFSRPWSLDVFFLWVCYLVSLGVAKVWARRIHSKRIDSLRRFIGYEEFFLGLVHFFEFGLVSFCPWVCDWDFYWVLWK